MRANDIACREQDDGMSRAVDSGRCYLVSKHTTKFRIGGLRRAQIETQLPTLPLLSHPIIEVQHTTFREQSLS